MAESLFPSGNLIIEKTYPLNYQPRQIKAQALCMGALEAQNRKAGLAGASAALHPWRGQQRRGACWLLSADLS